MSDENEHNEECPRMWTRRGVEPRRSEAKVRGQREGQQYLLGVVARHNTQQEIDEQL